MAENVAFFQFGNNAVQNAEEIARGLTETVNAIHNAARAAGGTQVPSHFGDGIIKEAERAAREASAHLSTALDPRNLTGKMTQKDTNDLLTRSANGAFQQIQREVDRMFSQLGPEAQRALGKSGELNSLMDHVATMIKAEIEGAYNHLRDQLPSALRPPTLNRLGPRLASELGNQERALQPAVEQRVGRIYQTDAEGDPKLNGDAYLAAEARAAAARVREAAARTRVELEAARTDLAKALADMVGHENNPYAKAFGYRLNPETGRPTRPTAGGGYEDIVDPRRIAEATANMEGLRRAVAQTKEGLESGRIRQIDKSSFFVNDTDKNNPSFFQKASQGGVEYLRLLDETETKLLSLRTAQAQYAREQNAPAARAAAERASQDARAAADAERQRRQEIANQERADARAQAESTRRREADARRVRGFIPGVIQGAFGSGFNGSGALDQGAILGNLGKTIGSAARYSLAYGGFYQFMRAMKDGVAIFADYQDSITDYSVALGSADSATQSTTNGLMELSRVLGENVGAAYDSAARGIRAFASDATEADKKIAGFATASAAQKISVIANKPLGDATGDVIATGSAYGLSAPQAELLIPDAVSNAKRNLGGDPGQISQGLANFAVTAKLAGYSIQEAANIISLVQGKTDESGQAVATRLTRVIQILGGSTGKSLAADVNRGLGKQIIDTSATPKAQLAQFGKAYVAAGKQNLPELQAQITSQLGGTGNLKEILPILEESGQKRLADALKKAIAGAGEDEYQRKVNTLMATLNRLRGSIQNLVVLAANSDLFAPFAAGVKVLEPTMHMLEQILQVYEKIEGLGGSVGKALGGSTGGKLGGAVGPIATLLAEATAGVYAFNKIKGSTFAGDVARNNPGLIGSAARSSSSATIAAEVAVRQEAVAAARAEVVAKEAAVASYEGLIGANEAEMIAAEELVVAKEAVIAAEAELAVATEAQAAASVTVMGSLRAVGRSLERFAPIAAVLASGLFLSDWYQKGRKEQQLDTSRRSLLVNPGTDRQSLMNTRDSLSSLSVSQTSELGWYGKLEKLYNHGDGPAQVTLQKRDQMGAILDRVSGEEAAAAQKLGVFGAAAGRTTDSLSAAFQTLAEQGKGATESLHEYFNALMQTPPPRLGTGETPDSSALTFTSQLDSSLMDAVPHLDKSNWWKRLTSHFSDRKPEVLKDNLATYFDQDAADQVFTDGIKKAGKNLNRAQVRALANKAFTAGFDTTGKGMKDMQDFPFNQPGGKDQFKTQDRPLGDMNAFRKRVVDKYFMPQVKILQHQARLMQPMSPAELKQLLDAQQAALQNADPTNPEAAVKQARENYLQLILRRNAQGTPAQRVKAAKQAVRDKFKEAPTGGLDALLGGALRGTAVSIAGDSAMNEYSAEQDAIRNARHVMRESAMNDAEDLRKAAEARNSGKGKSALQAIRIKLSKVSFRKAGGDITLLEKLFEDSDKVTVKALMDYQRTRMLEAKLAYEHMLALINKAQTILNEDIGGPALSGHPGASNGGQKRNTNPKLDKQRKRADELKKYAKRQSQILDNAEIALNRSAITDDDVTGKKDKKGKTPLTAWQQRALYAQAMTNPNNSILQARAGLEVARANLAAIKDKHSSEYFSALQAVTQAQWTLASTLGDKATAAANLAAARAGGGQMATARAALRAANIQIGLSDPGSVERLNALTSKASAGWQLRQAAAAKKGAAESAAASRTGGGIAQARAAIRSAAAQMRSTAVGTAEWFQALGSFYDGQRSMREAVVSYKNNLDLLRGDSTNPVEQARDALRAAARKLRSDRHQGKDVQAEDRVAVQDSRNALQQSKFEQRMSDMQTNEELGRIHFSKYMSFLDHEHDRLTKIKHRTRQQQDQLNEVDKAMKDALDSMDSQFNLGDINVNGLVYQMRRFKAEAGAGMSNPRLNSGVVGPNGATSTQNVTIAINGADVAKVRSIIDGYLGTAPAQRRTTARRKI